MGAWNTGVFGNDTALDTMDEMSRLIENYYKKLIYSEDEHEIMLAGFIYLATKDESIIEEFDLEPFLRYEIELVIKGLSRTNVGQYKYELIGNLYKCLDEVDNWTDKAKRKAEVQKMIDRITKED